MNVYQAPNVIRLPGYSPGVWVIPNRRVQIWGRADGKFVVHFPDYTVAVCRTLPSAIRRGSRNGRK